MHHGKGKDMYMGVWLVNDMRKRGRRKERRKR
jgi:hypothetical protein